MRVTAKGFFIIIILAVDLFAFVFIGLVIYQQYQADDIFEDISFDFSVFILLIFDNFY